MATGTTAEQIIDVVTPAAGESVTEGTILEWHVKVGDFIKANDTIVEISTDKVDLELPSPATGTVTEILIDEGDTVTVGQVIARIAAGERAGDGPPAAEASPAADGAPSAQAAATQTPPTAPPPAPEQPATQAAAPAQAAPGAEPDGAGASPPGSPATPAATPVAQRAAAAEGVDLTGIAGSGPAGRIIKSDVLSAAGNGSAAVQSPPPAAAPPAPLATPATPATAQAPPPPATAQAGDGRSAVAPPPGAEPLRGAAAALARYMELSREIPTATSFRTLTVSVLDGRRSQLKQAGQRVSFTHLIAYAIARAATQMPVMTDHFAQIDEKPNRVRDGQVNLGLAVDVERRDGSRTLLVPVIADAGRMTFPAFVAAYDQLV
ncbi:MAG TPA: biotin/lipoyl-containing protein, partial [Solirubrobacteraceae bacterium]|nr:biotin/lipoyl-containing protein [Solirubrobacteraceae bacterium]